MISIDSFIDQLRKTDHYIQYIYSQGGCYRFHLLLNKMYKGCIPYISGNKNHIITKYKGKYYDINGQRVCFPGYTKLSEEEIPMVEKWSFRKNNLIVLDECPHCEEPLVYE